MDFDLMNRQPWYTVPLAFIVGFLVSISVTVPILDYVVIFLFGILIGRILHKQKYGEKEIIVMNTIGLFIGYALGSIHSNWKILLVIFVVSSVLSYKAHDMGIMKRYSL